MLKSAQLLDAEEEEEAGPPGGAGGGGAIDADSMGICCMGGAVIDEDDIWVPNLGGVLDAALPLRLRGTSDSGIFSA